MKGVEHSMIHTVNDVMASVCRLTCGTDDVPDKGTAFLISPTRVLTATHNIKLHLQNNSIEIILEFLNSGNKRNVRKALPIEGYITSAVVILELDVPVNQCFLCFSDFGFGLGDEFSTFGYPTVKWNTGQWVDDKISRVLGETDYNPFDWNIDLSHHTKIADFSGLSGAPLLVEGKLVGVMISEATEEGKAISLGAIGISKFDKLLIENQIEIHEYMDPYLYELEEDYYKDFVFVEKLEAAQIFEHQFCQEEFYHAEILSNAVKSKDVKSEVLELARLKKDVKSYWQSQYLGYTDENSGALLLSNVYQQIELLADTTLNSKKLNASLYAKKGMLHQWADECKLGWVKNYKQNLSVYRKGKGGTSDETYN